MILPQKKGEEGKCNYGDWTTLKPKHYRYHHIKIFKKEKIEINKKTGMNGNTFKNIIKKKKRSALLKRWVYAHQRSKIP